MVEVFITSIKSEIESKKLEKAIHKVYPKLKINFDLEDIDNVLRIEGKFNIKEIIGILHFHSHKCDIMP